MEKLGACSSNQIITKNIEYMYIFIGLSSQQNWTLHFDSRTLSSVSIRSLTHKLHYIFEWYHFQGTSELALILSRHLLDTNDPTETTTYWVNMTTVFSHVIILVHSMLQTASGVIPNKMLTRLLICLSSTSKLLLPPLVIIVFFSSRAGVFPNVLVKVLWCKL